MARGSRRPWRTLGVFFLAVGLLFALVAVAGTWKPELGLDLQGGTRITLSAKSDSVDPANLEEAASIIDSRVNGSGVTEAEVTTSGNRYVVVEIPGETRADLVETVKRQALLHFRIVAKVGPGAATTGAASPSASPGAGVLAPSASATTKPGKSQPGKGQASKSPRPKAGPSTKPSSEPSAAGSPSASPSGSATPKDGGAGVDDPLAWSLKPDEKWVKKFDDFTCPAPGESTNVVDDPDQPLVTCDGDGNKYLLSAAMINGTDLKSASPGAPNQQSLKWVVQLAFDSQASDTFAKISRELYGTDRQFAIVLDGQVISAPTMNGIITNGQAEISGNFTEATARSLATSLKFGALPVAFEKDPLVQTVGPSLAGNQLSAGITAGVVGLLLVMLYCLLYYRGLGLVVIASLIVAGVITYGMVLLLSETANFTLSLPGIAGLIVAVGITADSFIVYFERIRDEMRDGKSMRVAVETGWARARNTCVAADAVSLLAAVVLYIFAAGVVRGFAFALGLSTLIDLVVFFWFTHPMVSLLARYPFFNKGHKLSGLDAEHVGLDRLPAGGAI